MKVRMRYMVERDAVGRVGRPDKASWKQREAKGLHHIDLCRKILAAFRDVHPGMGNGPSVIPI